MPDEFTRRSKSAWGEGAALKDEILQAATRLLADIDREGDLSLRAVARDVGISAPSVYLHFKDRAELVNEVVSAAYLALAEELRRAYDQASGSHDAGLRAMAHRYCSYVIENRGLHRVMFRLERRDTGPEWENHPAGPIYREWVSALQAIGGPDVDVEPRAKLLWMSMHGLVDLVIAMPSGLEDGTLPGHVDDLLGEILRP